MSLSKPPYPAELREQMLELARVGRGLAWIVVCCEYQPQESLGDVSPVHFKPRVFNAEVSTPGLSA